MTIKPISWNGVYGAHATIVWCYGEFLIPFSFLNFWRILNHFKPFLKYSNGKYTFNWLNVGCSGWESLMFDTTELLIFT
jgi:hypothetical protein